MNSKLLFPLILFKTRSCQRWDIYLYLASNWSGFWLCIFSHLFKSQKTLNHRLFVLIASLWATAVWPLLILFLSHIRNSQQGMHCDTESHCDKEVTPPLCTVSMYIALSVFTPSLQRPLQPTPPCPASLMHPSLLLHYCNCALPWAGTSSLSDCKRPFRGQ